MTDIEQTILRFVAEETGYNPKRLALDSRLAQDIGVDGDDAVELLQKFEKIFEVDLTSLYDHWDQHFGPEGGGPGMGFMVATGAAVVVGDLLNRAYRPIPTWAWMIAVLVGYLFIHAKFFTEPVNYAPIRVQELVNAAISRRWDRQYEQQEAMFRSVQ
jgi:acyl carrier protein